MAKTPTEVCVSYTERGKNNSTLFWNGQNSTEFIIIILLAVLFITSDFNNSDPTVELSFVESKAQAHRLSKGGGESVEVDQVVRRSHL